MSVERRVLEEWVSTCEDIAEKILRNAYSFLGLKKRGDREPVLRRLLEPKLNEALNETAKLLKAFKNRRCVPPHVADRGLDAIERIRRDPYNPEVLEDALMDAFIYPLLEWKEVKSRFAVEEEAEFAALPRARPEVKVRRPRVGGL
ncbi:MAG: hypothetical protein DRJ67_01510 [Thermoprotei archaeon]|nr:MAG: hypothetical protein DRJ67_01510 [Thermoprotei archaeon]